MTTTGEGAMAGHTHRRASRGQFRGEQSAVPESMLVGGTFGRMFRHLPAFLPSDELIDRLVDELVEGPTDGAELDNQRIAAGITYLGQFVDHDLTFDPTSSLDRQNDPDGLINFRTPNFDLDSVYGQGPADQPYLYQRDDPAKLLVGFGEGQGTLVVDGEQRDEPDLPRNTERTALIGDPRNDENIIVSQLHQAFLRLHNRLVDDIRAEGDGAVDLRPHVRSDDVFAEAQRLTRWHYQWVVLTELLPLICSPDVIAELVEEVETPAGVSRRIKPRRFYRPRERPFIPVEWSVAAYRFGHSLIRPSYHLSATLRGFRRGRPIDLFIEDPTEENRLEHLGGNRQLPAFWSIDWRFFFKQQDSDELLQLARLIDTKLAASLRFLPDTPGAPRFLAKRNLQRGRTMGLSSGQAVARRMYVPPLTAEQLGFEGEAPLWFYLLREAELPPNDGAHLGRVGSLIVAETMLGILAADPASFLAIEPTWEPVLPADVAPAPRDWATADLLRYAVPDDGRFLQPGG